MDDKIALIAGASGMVGSCLLNLLLGNHNYKSVIVLTRKPLKKMHPKLKEIVISFDHLDDVQNELRADHIYCCLGTTMKKAGSREAFRKVDYEYPLNLARVTKHQGASHFLLVSALGADKNSMIFYSRTKGEIEESVSGLNFSSYCVFRPSLILGVRNERRIGEEIGKFIVRVFQFVLVGPLKKYLGVQAESIARAMVFYAKDDEPGMKIIESEEILNF
ncbi:MAG: NAD-dependent epimerase/dehydratase family protein [Bacteroidetes bacterium]|nr:NAD-dependent epimerase/dehydratase family protein [Bacteroidota bacterium]